MNSSIVKEIKNASYLDELLKEESRVPSHSREIDADSFISHLE
jgi:hypothetical protein